MDYCPECGLEYNSTTNRLIKEGCGHDKCRQCLLASDSGCPQCPVEHLDEVNDQQPPDEYYVFEQTNYINEDDPTAADEEPEDAGKFEIYWENAEEPHEEHEEVEAEPQEQEVEEVEEHLVKYEEHAEQEEVIPETDPQEIVYADAEPEPTKPSTPRGRSARNKSSSSAVKQQRRAKTESAVTEQESARRKKPFTEENMPSHLQKLEPTPGSKACYECLICQKQLARTAFGYHVYCDPTIQKPFSCDQCEKTFRTADHFRYHANTHENEEVAFACDSCEKTFRNKTTLSTHFRQTHSGIPAPFACNTCEKTFFSAAKFKIHEDMHNDVLPYACGMCSRRFRLKENMVKHVNITHADTKPFACPVCEMTFKRLGSYRKHMERSHSSAPTLKISCKVCGKGFTHSTLLRRHEKEHLDQVEEYHCKLCTISCTRRDNMMRHMRMMHFEGDVGKTESLEDHMEVVERVKGVDGDYVLVEEVVEEVEEGMAPPPSDQEEENDEGEEQGQEGHPQERKSSVIIYVGAQGKTGAASPSKRRRGGSSGGRDGIGGSVSKRSRPVEVEDDFATMSSDKMEIYRKILMPSREYYTVEEGEQEGEPKDGSSSSGRRRRRVQK